VRDPTETRTEERETRSERRCREAAKEGGGGGGEKEGEGLLVEGIGDASMSRDDLIGSLQTSFRSCHSSYRDTLIPLNHAHFTCSLV
jgi:hypothetical protein